MKSKLITIVPMAALGMAFATWHVYASSDVSLPSDQAAHKRSSLPESQEKNLPVERSKSERQEFMDQEGMEITRRVGIAAALNLPEEGGEDPLIEAVKNGFIVEITLAEVEDALAKAAATPDSDDDKQALILRHRGSYRFFSACAD